MNQIKKKTNFQDYLTVSKEILGGTPVFKGTRVPIQILFDYLSGGENLQDFLENYPTVKKSVAKKILDLSASFLLNIDDTITR